MTLRVDPGRGDAAALLDEPQQIVVARLERVELEDAGVHQLRLGGVVEAGISLREREARVAQLGEKLLQLWVARDRLLQ